MIIYFALLGVLHRRFQLYQSDVHSFLTVRFTSLNLHLKNLPRLETFHHFVIKTEQKISCSPLINLSDIGLIRKLCA